nr:MAG: hypothetical protein DIU57_20205 [Pseudomonadota bacterium]
MDDIASLDGYPAYSGGGYSRINKQSINSEKPSWSNCSYNAGNKQLGRARNIVLRQQMNRPDPRRTVDELAVDPDHRSIRQETLYGTCVDPAVADDDGGRVEGELLAENNECVGLIVKSLDWANRQRLRQDVRGGE